MKILEYGDVDPLQVTYLTKLALDFALTPELVRQMRLSDPRPLPCLAVYGVEDDDVVVGQVGIFRLPMVSINGREDVGGVWAVSTHPQYARKGVASHLLEEAHSRMRASGLRFSTLGTDQSRVSHRLYSRHGYMETNVWATALARWEKAHQPTRLRAQPPGPEGYSLVEQIFSDVAGDYLGFAWRHTPFARLRNVDLSDIWVLRENGRYVGYVLARADSLMLTISNLVLRVNVDAAEAIAAIAGELRSTYVDVKISRPVEMASLRRAGFHIAHPNWNGFMIKSLDPEVDVAEAWPLFGIGSDRFLISWLDVT